MSVTNTPQLGTPSRAKRHGVVFVRIGSFSGGASALLSQLRALTEVEEWNLARLPRNASLLRDRLSGMREARAEARGIPWTRTGAWARGIQRWMEQAGVLKAGRPLLFLQTLAACQIDPSVPYWIYTDRVGLEGAATGGPYRSRFSQEWLARERLFIRGAREIFVHGPSTVGFLEEGYGVPEERIHVVGGGPIASPGGPRPREALRKLLFVGRNWELKGGPELLAAFERVRSDLPGLELTIVGGRPRGRIPGGVRKAGSVSLEDMPALYLESDALVIPTHMEAFGYSLLEGLLSGLPCIGSTVGNQEWIIGPAGLCIAPGDVPALAEAIRGLARRYPAFRDRALERAEAVRDRFAWSAVASTILGGIYTDRSPQEGQR